MEGESETGPHPVKYVVGKSAGISGLVAALIATHVATVSGLWFDAARLPKFDFNSLNGFLALGLPYGFTHPFETFLVGGVIHYLSGIIWGLVFALVIHPMMGRTMKPLAALTPTNNYIKGLLWGWTLWIISSALWMPLLIGPLLAPYGVTVGTFLTSFGPFGVQALFTNLLWHSIYGLNLGLLFSPVPAPRTGWMRSSAAGMR